VEFAVRDGVPYAIDFTNPAPDMAIDSILEPHFWWCVEHMAELAINAAKEGKSSMGRNHRFTKYLSELQSGGLLLDKEPETMFPIAQTTRTRGG
jgi:hypothetical protein